MKKSFELLDICYPDYFAGYHRTVITVSLNPITTNKDVVDAICDELNNIETDFSRTEHLIVDEYIGKLMEDSEAIFFEDPDYRDCEDVPEWYELYAYFSLCRLHVKYGITFCDR